MVKFITLAGKKQVGKDTSAKYIKELLSDRRVHIVHFADALKQACHAIFGISLEDMETDIGKQKLTEIRWPVLTYDGYVPYDDRSKNIKDINNGRFMTIREILQFVGTDLFRMQMDPDLWVKSVYRKKWRDDDIVIVADCRFPNEAAFAKEQGLLISVERETGLTSDGHVSETALDNYENYDYVIDNNASFEALRERVQDILTRTEFIVGV